MTHKTLVQPYVFFDGKCDEAIEFYKRALNAEVCMLMRFKDNPEPSKGCQPEGCGDKVMHAQLRIGDSVIMMSDGRCTGKANFEGFSLSLTVPTEAEADKAFKALSDGGNVQVPLDKTFFSPRFGMVIDRFGVFWMVLVTPTTK